MPSRIVREGIITSSRINALSMGAEVFYRRLMSVVDDFGRYHGSVVTLRGACWPTNPERIREKDVSKWLNELLMGDRPLVKTYNVHGSVYLEIQEFEQQTRSKSKFPDPPWAESDSNCLANAKQKESSCEENVHPSRIRSRISNTSPENGSLRVVADATEEVIDRGVARGSWG